MAAVAIAGVSGPADASDISIPFDDLVFGQPGSTVTIASADVSAEMVGRTCHLVVVAENQSSVHIGNDLIVSTGGSQAVIFGVEDTPNGGTSETYEMVVGPTILVQLRIGQDGMSSLGFDLSFDCLEPVVEATTSTIEQQQLETTTTTAATTTTADCSSTNTTTGQAGVTTVAGQAGSAAEGCDPDCTGAGTGAGSGDGAASTTVAGQATTDTTVCGSAQVTNATTTTTAVTPTVAGSSTNQLPETPAAQAVPGSPSYTG